MNMANSTKIMQQLWHDICMQDSIDVIFYKKERVDLNG